LHVAVVPPDLPTPDLTIFVDLPDSLSPDQPKGISLIKQRYGVKVEALFSFYSTFYLMKIF
jgi:hypothetical protein